jgi:hypothetical protein
MYSHQPPVGRVQTHKNVGALATPDFVVAGTSAEAKPRSRQTADLPVESENYRDS